MLRESSNVNNIKFDISEVTQDNGVSNDNDIDAAVLLSDFAEAVVRRDNTETERLRGLIISKLGEEGFVDAAATTAAFHGFVRVADSTGIPHNGAAGGGDSSALQKETGIDQFYAAGLGDRG